MSSKDRYARHLVLKEIGPAGQKKLESAAVLIVGCGALGSAQAQVLARAGIGRLRICDGDHLEISNLPRQILYDEEDLASKKPKAELAAAKLRKINSNVSIEGITEKATEANIAELTTNIDLVLDATDNFEARYLINSTCVSKNLPWIYGGILGSTGMTMPVFPRSGPCLRCLFPQPPTGPDVPTPAQVGILSSAPLIIGAMQATAAMKYIIEGRTAEEVKLTILELWSQSFRSIAVSKDPKCSDCGN